jgi:cyclopropane fatty-acyl-phospholipid synthase-like methyltransferase
VAKAYVADAGIEQRVSYLAGNALDVAWPPDIDVVLMSYLLSAVGNEEINTLFQTAFAALRPGGLLVVHDFMVADDKSGPATAALWMMVLAGSENPVCLTEADLAPRAAATGFVEIEGAPLVPTITRVFMARKPA